MAGKVRQVNCRTCDKHFVTTDQRKMSCSTRCAKLYSAHEQHVRRRNRPESYYEDYEWPRPLQRNYGITVDDYNKMSQEQSGKCAICHTHQIEMKKKLAVDHCHETGKVRGLLCEKCNRGLGFFQDSRELLRRAMEYLT